MTFKSALHLKIPMTRKCDISIKILNTESSSFQKHFFVHFLYFCCISWVCLLKRCRLDIVQRCEKRPGIVGEEMDHDIDYKPCHMGDNKASCIDDLSHLLNRCLGGLLKM